MCVCVLAGPRTLFLGHACSVFGMLRWVMPSCCCCLHLPFTADSAGQSSGSMQCARTRCRYDTRTCWGWDCGIYMNECAPCTRKCWHDACWTVWLHIPAHGVAWSLQPPFGTCRGPMRLAPPPHLDRPEPSLARPPRRSLPPRTAVVSHAAGVSLTGVCSMTLPATWHAASPASDLGCTVPAYVSYGLNI